MASEHDDRMKQLAEIKARLDAMSAKQSQFESDLSSLAQETLRAVRMQNRAMETLTAIQIETAHSLRQIAAAQSHTDQSLAEVTDKLNGVIGVMDAMIRERGDSK